MTLSARAFRLVGLPLLLAVVVAGLAWLLSYVMPPPLAAPLALAVIGLLVTEVIKRQPRQHATRLLYAYLRARQRGADERDARERLLARATRDRGERARLAMALEGAWAGDAERERVLGGLGALLARQGKALDDELLGASYDRVRDRFTITAWDALPKAFVDELRGRLDARDIAHLDALTDTYRLFQQRFFRQSTSLGLDPAASVADFARLLASLGNRLRKDEPGDAERAYRLSLRLRPEDNLAHAGLALLLAQTGHNTEAAREARIALGVLDAYAGRQDRAPTTEDISPFRSPTKLREALEQVAAAAERTRSPHAEAREP